MGMTCVGADADASAAQKRGLVAVSVPTRQMLKSAVNPTGGAFEAVVIHKDMGAPGERSCDGMNGMVVVAWS